MLDLNFTIENQKLTCDNPRHIIVQKTNNYIRLNFTFTGAEWDNLTKYVVVKNAENKNYLYEITGPVILSDDVMIGKWFVISVYGTINNYRITTNRINFYMRKTGYTTDITSRNASIDVVEDIYNHLEALMELEIKKGFREIANKIRTYGE